MQYFINIVTNFKKYFVQPKNEKTMSLLTVQMLQLFNSGMLLFSPWTYSEVKGKVTKREKPTDVRKYHKNHQLVGKKKKLLIGCGKFPWNSSICHRKKRRICQ